MFENFRLRFVGGVPSEMFAPIGSDVNENEKQFSRISIFNILKKKQKKTTKTNKQNKCAFVTTIGKKLQEKFENYQL